MWEVTLEKSTLGNVYNVRGSFKKFCYEHLPMHKKRMRFTNFMYTYSSFYHIYIYPHVKYERNQSNVNNGMCIHNNLSHIHWPLFEDEKGERVKI